MRILVTNDDGVRSEGIHALARAVARLGEVTIVAPHLEASAIGHALTLRRPLRVEQLDDRVYEVDGTPTDCVNIAITKILGALSGSRCVRHQQGLQPRRRRDVLGDGGRRAGGRAARDPESSPSRCERTSGAVRFRPRRGRRCARRRSRARVSALPARTFLNINVPPGTSEGHPRDRPGAPQSRHRRRRAHRSARQAYYWIEEGQNDWEPHDRSDYQAVRDGYVSVTPLQPDLTDSRGVCRDRELSLARRLR